MSLSKNLKNVKVIKYDGKNVDEIVKNLPSQVTHYTTSGNKIILFDGGVRIEPGNSITNETGEFHVYGNSGCLKW